MLAVLKSLLYRRFRTYQQFQQHERGNERLVSVIRRSVLPLFICFFLHSILICGKPQES